MHSFCIEKQAQISVAAVPLVPPSVTTHKLEASSSGLRFALRRGRLGQGLLRSDSSNLL